MDIYDQLVKCTVKINCDDVSSGTGFFFKFDFGNDLFSPVIVTNRHVMENAQNIKLIFSLSDYFEGDDRCVELEEINIYDVQNAVIYHENPDIDLCVIPILSVFEYFKKYKQDPRISFLGFENIPNNKQLEELRFVEDIMMVGYPNGISDFKNNFPIFRKGITATHPGVDFNGQPEFLVDMTIIPGSSGSPVFLINDSGFRDKLGNINIGATRFYLLGINKAVFTANAEGKIVEIPAPTELKVYSQIGINLGIIISAKELRYFEDEIKRRSNLGNNN
ncbi:serine protease [Macrococcus caseolyticus]|uniref:S1 family peptidase n=1 Tax=Macrococcoides caseolyticum TaxID=69966 RepID=UPI0024BD59ED|nr:serine protease [Macrococcus caseolyticus]MDJ1152369.1 serine protease [Macrococcus caseolyticus]